MNRFIGRILMFASIVAVIVIALIGMHYLVLSKVSFKLPQEKTILILGDSHTEHGIDDTVFSRADNVSLYATSYLYSYFKLEKFLKENNHIDTLLLSFHDVAILGDAGMLNEQNMMRQIRLHLTLFDKEAITTIFNENKKAFISSILNPSPVLILKFISKSGAISYKDIDIGAYHKLYRDKLQTDISLHNTQPSEEKPYSPIQKKYLLKIVSLCKSKNITLILINTPIYKPDLYGHLDTVNDFYNTYLSGVTYINYSAFPLPDSCYADIGHLNYKGAEIFSKYLQEHFNSDLEGHLFTSFSPPPPPSPANTSSTTPHSPPHPKP